MYYSIRPLGSMWAVYCAATGCKVAQYTSRKLAELEASARDAHSRASVQKAFSVTL